MNDTLRVGDKVWYKTVMAGTIKAKIVEINLDEWVSPRYTLKVTSRKNKIYYCGYVFSTNSIHIWAR